MIVKADGSYEQNSNQPNGDMGYKNVKVVDETSPEGKELASKIISLWPNSQLVIDGDGNITDVIAVEPPAQKDQSPASQKQSQQDSEGSIDTNSLRDDVDRILARLAAAGIP